MLGLCLIGLSRAKNVKKLLNSDWLSFPKQQKTKLFQSLYWSFLFILQICSGFFCKMLVFPRFLKHYSNIQQFFFKTILKHLELYCKSLGDLLIGKIRF